MIPLPNEEATPPVTKMYFVSPTTILFLSYISKSWSLRLADFGPKAGTDAALLPPIF